MIGYRFHCTDIIDLKVRKKILQPASEAAQKNTQALAGNTPQNGQKNTAHKQQLNQQEPSKQAGLSSKVAAHPANIKAEHQLLRPDLTGRTDRKSTRLNSSHVAISYAVFCLK